MTNPAHRRFAPFALVLLGLLATCAGPVRVAHIPETGISGM